MSEELVENKEPEKVVPFHVTTLSELQEYAKGTVVRLPDFAKGQPFVARLVRPSMLQMVKSGVIPNTLLTRANSLFFDGAGGLKVEDEEAMSQIFEVIDVICRESFVEPTYDQIVSSGIKLTDEQMMFVFNYSQRGVNALQSFRNE